MSSLIPEGGGAGVGDGAGVGGAGVGDAGGGETSLDAAASPAPPPMASDSVDNWLGSTSFSMQAGSQQPEAPLSQSSPMGCRYASIICWAFG